MRSLLEDVAAEPRVGALLDAVDSALNGNTFLLKARADRTIRAGNHSTVIECFIRSRAFEHLIRSADHNRHWDNLRGGKILPDSFTLTVQDMTEPEFEARLRWMLTEAFSPYRMHVTAERADELTTGFIDWLYADRPASIRRHAPWTFSDVSPTFLHCTGYHTGQDKPPGAAAYFDGGSSDTATFMYRGNIMMLLLSN